MAQVHRWCCCTGIPARTPPGTGCWPRPGTVVCPDLRGYGQSSKPPTIADHTPYSKRAMAGDVLALMHHLGHERFAVVGHGS